MARPTATASSTSTYLWAVVAVAGVCRGAGPYGSSAGAVVQAVPRTAANGTSRARPDDYGITAADGARERWSPDGLVTSQTRVGQVDGRRGSADRVAGKDYDGGFAAYNTYGPPRDYYYDERPPEYFGPPPAAQVDGYRGPPTYHPSAGHGQQTQYPELHHGGPAGEVHRPGELNIQPLLLPLAGVALLGVLSALIKTPLLLHLGHVGRRRRDVRSDARITLADAIKSLLDKFNDQGRRRDNLQSCLVCDVVASTYDRESSCPERSVCEVMSRQGPSEIESDKRLLTAIIARISENDQIPETFRKRLQSAELSGKNAANCRKLYPCAANEWK